MPEETRTSEVTYRRSDDMDLRMIPEFDGVSQPVAEWIEKLELVCDLRGIYSLHSVIPLRLAGGAFAVYQQLSAEDKRSFSKIKDALISAFAVDRYQAYERFVSRKLCSGEAVHVYLADLRRFAGLFGGLSDTGLACAFVAGLPEATRRVLRAGSRMEAMDISQLLSRARAVVVEDDGAAPAFAAVVSSPRRFGNTSRQFETTRPDAATVLFHVCHQPNHYARDCLSERCGRGRGAHRGARGHVRCFRCGVTGHIVSSCPENSSGGAASAPVSSPVRQ